jgi:hypothetical protein
MIPSTVLLLHFDEPEGVSPADALGNLDDLGTEPGIVAPDVVQTWSGIGRRFAQANTNALIARDSSDLGTMLPRDASIQALISFTLDGASGPQTIIARGVNDGSIPERYAFGLEVQEQAGNPSHLEVRWFWSDASGAIVTAPPGVFFHAGDGREIMLTATRRWEASGRIVVRYYIDSRMIAELDITSTISGGVTGTMTIGARKSAGAWGRFLNGTIDELAVLDYELCAEEIRATWERLTIHQPAGFATFRGLAPPGVSWFDSPSSDIARRAKVVGQAIGLLVANIEEFRATFLPGSCPAWLLPLWERLYTMSPKPLDSLDVRRARVLARMAAEEGYSIPTLQAAFSVVFGIDADEVEILENTNDLVEPFDSIADEKWTSGAVGAWSISGGELALAVPSGTDVNQSPTLGDCRLWTAMDRTDVGSIWFGAKIVDYTALPSGSFVGLCLHRRVGNKTLWFGVRNNGATIDLVTCEGSLVGGFSAITVLATIASGPVWLRISLDPGEQSANDDTPAPLVLSWSTSGPSSGFTTHNATAYPWYDLAGFGAYTTSTPGANINARFDDARVFVPKGLAPFAWFAYRDPSLPGSYDLIGANALARAVAPAHTYAAACSSKRLLCGDPVFGLVGWVPMGTP